MYFIDKVSPHMVFLRDIRITTSKQSVLKPHLLKFNIYSKLLLQMHEATQAVLKTLLNLNQPTSQYLFIRLDSVIITSPCLHSP